MSQVTTTGYELTRLDERIVQLAASFQAVYGPDINLDPNSPDGQTLGIFAESVNNLEQLGQDVYNTFNPNTATGVALSNLVQLNGIRRLAGSFSTVILECVGQQNTVIPAGSLVRSQDGASEWATAEDATIDASGQVDVAATSTVIGAVGAAINTLNQIVSPVYGWQAVNNNVAAIAGTVEESDEKLRARRLASTTTTATGIVDAIRGALLNQQGVTQAIVYENAEDVADPATGQAPHSIYPIVVGGDPLDIATVIWFKKSAGVTLLGSVTQNVLDTAGNTHMLRFDRPAVVSPYIVVNVVPRAGYPANGDDLIKQALVDFSAAMLIGQELSISDLYPPIIANVPGVRIASLFQDLIPSPSATDDIETPYNAIVAIDPARVTVNLVAG